MRLSWESNGRSGTHISRCGCEQRPATEASDGELRVVGRSSVGSQVFNSYFKPPIFVPNGIVGTAGCKKTPRLYRGALVDLFSLLLASIQTRLFVPVFVDDEVRFEESPYFLW